MAVVKLTSVNKKFKLRDTITLKRNLKENTIEVLQDINFSLNKGEALAVIGSNGAGKSTLLKVIAGIIKPDSGTVIVKGKITPVFDTGAIFRFELTGRENIYYYGSLLGYGKRFLDKKINDIIEFSELKNFIDVKVKKYSLGMISRLAFSVATSQHPDILILDEVQAVGDRIFRQKSFNRIASMKKKGSTIIFVTQSTDEVRLLADKTLYLKQGKMEKYGRPSEVTMHYIEDTESQLKHSLSNSISKLYELLKNPSKKSKKKEGSFFGLNLFKKVIAEEKSNSDIKIELEEKIRLLKHISLDEIMLFERLLEKEHNLDNDFSKQRLLKKINDLIGLIKIELEIAEKGKKKIYDTFFSLKSKERAISGDIEVNSMDYEILNMTVDQLYSAENDHIKYRLLESLYGLRELSKLKKVSLSDEKKLIQKYVSFLKKDHTFDIQKRTVEFFRLLLTISAFNTRLDEKFLLEITNSFFEFIKSKLSNKDLEAVSEEISKIDNLFNWGNENYVDISTNIIYSFFNFDIKSPKFNKYINDFAQKTLTEIDERIIVLHQDLFEENNKITIEKLQKYREYRTNLSKVIINFRTVSKFKERQIIKKIKCYGKDGKEKNRFTTNDYFKIRVYYDSKNEIKNPVFGIAIYTDSGNLITGPNTMYHGYKINSISGEGYIDYIIKKLPLLMGYYLISVAVHSETSFKPFESVDKLYSFEVMETKIKDFGTVFINAEWQHSSL